MRLRFEREVEAAASLDHPNIVTVYGSELIDGQWVLSMQWIDGVPIDRWALAAGVQGSALHDARGAALHGARGSTSHDARRSGGRNVADAPGVPPGGAAPERPSPREVLTAFASICDAVAHAHQRGVIHRDLKPSNILIDAAGQPHVLDFGLAKRTGGGSIGADDPSGATATLTHTGDFVGTPAFAAPEQLRGDSAGVDARTDVYSLGAVLYYTLTGRLPFADAKTLHELMRFAQERDPPPPSMRARRLDREIDAIVLMALASEPPRRYASVRELGDDVQRYLAGRPVSAHAPSLAYRLRKFVHRRRTGLMVAGACVVLLLAAAGVSALSRMQVFHASRERDEAQRVAAAAGLEGLMQRGEALERQKKLAEAEALYREVYEKRLALVGEGHESTAAAAFALGRLVHGAGRVEEADALLTSAFDARLERYGARHALTASAAAALAGVRFDQANYAAAEELLQIEAEQARATGIPFLARRAAANLRIDTLCLLGRWGQAAELMRESVDDLAREDAAAGQPKSRYERRNLAQRRLGLCDLLRRAGQEREAVEVLTQAHGELAAMLTEERAAKARSREFPYVLRNVAQALMLLGRPAEAEPLLRESMPLWGSTYGLSTRAAAAHSFLGECLRQLGKLDEAEAVLLEAFAGLGSDANSRFRVALSLIDLYDAAGQSEKAARWRACIQAKPHREWAPPGIPAAQPALIAPEGDGEAE